VKSVRVAEYYADITGDRDATPRHVLINHELQRWDIGERRDRCTGVFTEVGCSNSMRDNLESGHRICLSYAGAKSWQCLALLDGMVGGLDTIYLNEVTQTPLANCCRRIPRDLEVARCLRRDIAHQRNTWTRRSPPNYTLSASSLLTVHLPVFPCPLQKDDKMANLDKDAAPLRAPPLFHEVVFHIVTGEKLPQTTADEVHTTLQYP
jgi:hypothetical protein